MRGRKIFSPAPLRIWKKNLFLAPKTEYRISSCYKEQVWIQDNSRWQPLKKKNWPVCNIITAARVYNGSSCSNGQVVCVRVLTTSRQKAKRRKLYGRHLFSSFFYDYIFSRLEPWWWHYKPTIDWCHTGVSILQRHFPNHFVLFFLPLDA